MDPNEGKDVLAADEVEARRSRLQMLDSHAFVLVNARGAHGATKNATGTILALAVNDARELESEVIALRMKLETSEALRARTEEKLRTKRGRA